MVETVKLSKGETVNLSKAAPSLTRVMVGTGWDMKEAGAATMDCDLVAFILNSAGNVRGADDFIFYNHRQNSNGSVKHSGDNLTGEGEGDDEQMTIDLTKLDSEVTRIAIGLDIYQAAQKGQNFSDVDNAFIRIVNEETGEELSRFDLTDDMTGDYLEFVELYKDDNGEWNFRAVGNARTAELGTVATEFGLRAAA